MSKKKSLKKPRQPGTARGVAPGSPPEGRPTMPSEDHLDPRDGTAVIAPVTDAMMDHAAHEAAALADGVAHHRIAVDAAAAETPDAVPAPAAEPEAEDMVQVDAAPADTVDTVVGESEDAAVRLTRDSVDGAERLAGAARDASSASADALTRYNAKVFEMMRANAASATALFAALVQAKSVPEALSLNADHLRRQVETLTSQGRELATLAQRVALDAMQPFKGPADR